MDLVEITWLMECRKAVA